MQCVHCRWGTTRTFGKKKRPERLTHEVTFDGIGVCFVDFHLHGCGIVDDGFCSLYVRAPNRRSWKASFKLTINDESSELEFGLFASSQSWGFPRFMETKQFENVDIIKITVEMLDYALMVD